MSCPKVPRVPTAEEVREALAPLRSPELQRLADLSGMSFGTLWKIAAGRTPNPGLETVGRFLPHLDTVLSEMRAAAVSASAAPLPAAPPSAHPLPAGEHASAGDRRRVSMFAVPGGCRSTDPGSVPAPAPSQLQRAVDRVVHGATAIDRASDRPSRRRDEKG